MVPDSVGDIAHELLAEFVARRSVDEDLDFDDFARARPEHEARLRELWVGWDDFELDLAVLGARIRATKFQAELQPGQELGDFHLVELIASGGMGQVWVAQQRSLDRRVALKVMKPERATERGRLFFEREARAGGRLAHPGLVSILAAGEDEGVHWIAMELVEGGRTLRDVILELRARRELDPDHYRQVAELFSRICDAVQAAHDCGVIHRDLKPSNVLIAPDGAPKITDFGLARIIDELALSHTGEFSGTCFYMSPEQVTARRIGIDHRTDVFSLGVVLYEVLTLRRPFDGQTGHEVAERILYDEPRDPRHIGAEVPAPLAWICARAIEKRRNDRYSSMRELGDDLQRFVEQRQPRARPAGPLRKLQRWSRRRPVQATAAGLGAALVAVSLVLALVLFGGRAEERLERWQELTDGIAIAALRGDFEGARANARKALELDPTNSSPHVELACALMGAGRLAEASAELERAIELGIPQEHVDDSEPAALTRRAMLRFVRGDWHAEPALVTADLERALELDASQPGAWSVLYHVRLATADHTGAADALQHLRGWTVEQAVPEVHRWCDALEREAEGDMQGAVVLLEAMRDDATLDPARVARLPIDPALGRASLVLARDGGDANDLERAQAAFERAIEALDGDQASRVNLALVHALRLQRASDASSAPAQASIDAARAALAEVFATHPDHVPALEAACQLEVACLVRELDALPPPPAEVWEASEEMLERLRALAPNSASLANASAWYEFLVANALVGEGEWSDVAEFLERCLAHDPDHFWALVLGAQVGWQRAELEEGIAFAERAERLWDAFDERARKRWGRTVHAELHVWRLWLAEHSERPELVGSSPSEIERALADGIALGPETLFNYAEWLARSIFADQRDCARVRELFDGPVLTEWLASSELSADHRDYVMAVRADCGL